MKSSSLSRSAGADASLRFSEREGERGRVRADEGGSGRSPVSKANIEAAALYSSRL
jgi:hypothetical protein